MAMRFDKRGVQTITRGATHVRATMAWEVPEPSWQRTPILRSHWLLAWQLVALHLNGVPRLLEDLRQDPGSFVSDARARYNVRLAQAIDYMQELEAQEYAAWANRERSKATAFVANLYGARFDFEALNKFAFEWMHAVLEDQQIPTPEERLARAAGGALLYILMCYRNVLDVRDLETGEIDPIANWGGSTVLVDSRSQLSHLGVLPEITIGVFGTPEVALREELIAEVLARVGTADIVSGDMSTVFARLRQELFNSAKRESATQGANRNTHLGGLPFSVVANTFSVLLGDRAVRDQLIVATDIANQWRTFAASEHKGILEWLLSLCHDAAIVREVTLQMDQNFSDVQGVSMDRLSTYGFERVLAMLVEYEDEKDDLRAFYERQLAELAALHPTSLVKMELRHVREFRLEELTHAVFMPTVSFEHAERRERNGVIEHVNAVRKYNLGAPRLCVTDSRLEHKSLELGVEFLAPFSLKTHSSAVDIMPMIVRSANELPTPIEPLRAEIERIIRMWHDDVTLFASSAVAQHGSLLVKNKHATLTEDGEPVEVVMDWRTLLEQAAVARLLSGGAPVLLSKLPSALVYWLGFFVNDELQVLQFSVADNASDILQEYHPIEGGFVWVDHSKPATVKQVARVMAKADEFKWSEVRKAGFLPLFAIDGDGTVEPRKGRFVDERFNEGWWMQVRKTLLPVRGGMAPDLERVGKDLTVMLPLAPLHPDVPVLRRGGDVQGLMLVNGRAATHATRLLNIIMDDDVWQFCKTSVRRACREYLRGLVARWMRVMEQRFVGTVSRAATLFSRSDEEVGQWSRLVGGSRGRANQIADLQCALTAIMLAELGGDAYGVLYLAHVDRLDLLADRRLKLAVELWSPDDITRGRLQDMAPTLKHLAEVFNEPEVSQVRILCERVVGVGLNLKAVAEQLAWLRSTGEAVLEDERLSSELRRNNARSNPMLFDSPVTDDGAELDSPKDDA